MRFPNLHGLSRTNDHRRRDPSISDPIPPPICTIPGKNMTLEALDNLILHLKDCIARMRSNSALPENSSQVWKKYTSDIPGFLKAIEERQEQKATGKQIAKDTALPLLKEVLEGIGSLHWVAFGCSMLAWGIDKLDKQNENFYGCLDVLTGALFLVEHTRYMWDHEDQLDRTEGGASSSSKHKHKHMMESILPQITDVAFTASAICVSCSPRRDLASWLTSFLGAHTVEASIIKLNGRIMMLGQQNLGIGQEQMMQMIKGIMVVRRALSGYLSGEEEGTIGSKELKDRVESMLKVEDKETAVAAVCLHGMGGVGKSTLALTVFDKLVRQKKFVTCFVEMKFESEERDLPRFQEQILQEISSQLKKGNNQMFGIPNARDGKARLRSLFKHSKGTPILLYIDNVEHPEFLCELLPNVRQLPMGSRLLMTSRNAKASTYLHELGVKEDACHPIEVKTLDGELSRALLRNEVKDKQILDSDPTLRDLEDQVLRLCGGLPSALKLIGSHIARRAKGGPYSAETWMDVVNAMNEARPVDGNDKDGLYASLRLSIDKLNDALRFDLFVLVTCACMVRDLLWDMDMVRLEFSFGAQGMQDLIDCHLLEEVVEDGRRVRVGCHEVTASLVKRMVLSRGEHELRIIQGTMSDETSEELDEEKAAGNIGSISWMQVTDAQLRRMKRLRYAFEITVSGTISASSALMKALQLEHLRVLQIREGKSEGRLKLGRLPRLRVLFVEDGNAVELEELVAPDLRELHYYSRGRDRQSLSGCIHHFSDLRSLHLKVDWESLPEGISMLTTLRFLTLDACQNLQDLPQGIFTFKSLMKLGLEGCESLQNIPEGIGQLTGLHDLCLRHCKRLQDLPQGISKLIALKVLNLSGCESLTDIPEGICELTSLSVLDLCGCKNLKGLPEGISMRKAPKKSVDLSGLELTSKRNDGIATMSQEQAIGQQEIMEELEEQMLLRTQSEYYTLEEDEDYLIGRRELLDEVEFLLKTEDDKQRKKVVAVCLLGMGGVGKTALALTIFEKLRKQQKFVSCYVAMELESEQRDLPRFQEQILQEINSQRIGRTSDHHIRIRNALHGREMLLRQFKENTGTPILLYIDNVQHPQYLLDLLPGLTHLPFGSRLLITSRNECVSAYLQKLDVDEDACHSMEVKTLDGNPSRALLRKVALAKVRNKQILDSNPTLRSLEDEVLSLCGGLPLALKVTGSYIAVISRWGPESVETWRHVVSAMKEAMPVEGNRKDILYEKLRVSINALDESQKSHLFDLVTYELYERCDFVRLESIFGAGEMQELIDRHLLEVVKEDGLKVECHSIIASLVRHMVWDDIHDELRILHVLKSQEDVDELGDVGSIESADVTDVQLRQMWRLRYAFDVNVRITTGGSAMVDMPDLKVLEIRDVKSEGPLKLKLKLGGFPNLRVLSVKKDGDVVDLQDLMAPNLRELQYDGGDWQSLSRCIHHFSDLRSLRLAVDWENLPEGISKLASLTHLDLGGCKKLQALPDGISMLTSLSHLDLTGCESLEALPEGISMLTALSELHLRGCE